MPKINNKIEFGLKKKIYEIYFNIDEVQEPYKYDLYFFTLKNIGILPESTAQVGILLNSIFSIAGLVYIFLLYDFYMVFFMFIGVLAAFAMVVVKNKIIYNITIKNIPNDRKVDYINRLFYIPDYAKEVRTSNHNLLFSYLKKSYADIISEYLKKAKEISLLDFCSKTINSLIIIIVLILLGFKVINGIFTFSVFIMLFTGAQQILSDLNNLFSGFPQIYSLALKMDKVREFIEMGNKGGCRKNNINKIEKIELKNVHYTYDNQKKILEDINLSLSATAGIISLIGGNGSGKTTAINLVLGLLKPSSGEVLVNGVNLGNIDMNEYYEKISIVFQDFYIFSFSIYENLTGSSDINVDNESKVIEVLKKVGLYEKVEKFEKGIHTVISDEFDKQNGGLSRGEMQKLSFAGALYKDGDVFILDEVDSSLDRQYKLEISTLISELRHKKIVLIVTHNSEILSISDKIYKIDGAKMSLSDI